jgi:hypothetical protein
MADQWYYQRDGHKVGPCSAQQLKDLGARGEILPDDTIWKEGTARGALAKNVKNLFRPVPEEKPPADEKETAASIPAEDLENEPGLVPLTSTAEASSGSDQLEAEAALVDAGAGQDPPQKEPQAVSPPADRKKHFQKARAVAVRGAVIVSQDGVIVQYKKKCGRCNLESTSRTTMQIRQGMTRINYYCPKCRKTSPVEIQGIT